MTDATLSIAKRRHIEAFFESEPLGDRISFENLLDQLSKKTKVDEVPVEPIEKQYSDEDEDEDNKTAMELKKNTDRVQRYTLEEILQSSPQGRQKLKHFKKIAMMHSEKVKLCGDIVAFFLDKNIMLGKTEFLHIAGLISAAFPCEEAHVYAQAKKGGKAHGILADKYFNEVSKGKAAGYILKRKPEVSEKDKPREIFIN
jgi:hypothetical protein